MPPSVPGEHLARGDKPCEKKNVWYPIYDTVSVAAGISWVLYANQHIADIATQNAAASAGDITASHSDDSLYKYERAAGYSIIALYGASAIYGYIAEVKCGNWRNQRAHGEPAAADGAKRAGFPGSVYGFGFSMKEAQAAQLCASKGQEWHLEGATGLCQAQVASVANPDLRLEFRLGVPSEITVIYRAAPEGMNKNFSELSAALRGTYGTPQVEPAHASAECATSLARCLEHGEHPGGPVWHWAGGTIELSPVWQEDHALLELRYTREEPQAE